MAGVRELFKRALELLGVVVVLILFSACGNKEGLVTDSEEPDSLNKKLDMVLITDYGTIKDGSFNQGAWEGLSQYAEEEGISVAYIEPQDATKESYLEEIKNGVKNGATVVICPGYMFEEAVYEAQSKYSNVNFIILDGQPHNADYSDVTTTSNTESIIFAEEQAGFLAGYAAVRDGYTHLGFMGGVPEDSVIKYGYGFVQGADYAAIEMGVKVNIRYVYMNTFNDNNIVEQTADAWYEDDTEVIFACGGAIGKAVIRSAESHDRKVIGVDRDQSQDSETVITSAVKSVKNAVYLALKAYSNKTFMGGSHLKYDAKSNGIYLPIDSSRFTKFTADDYNSILSRLSEGTILPYDGTDLGTTQELTLVNTNVTYIVL